MKNDSITLFVFEGEKKERQYLHISLDALSIDIERIEIAFCTHIYALYQKLEESDGLDIFELLKECKALGEDTYYDKDDIARIYLFFDYDGHAPEANNANIESILKRFDNETEDGKLFLSYPMLEALADASPNFQDVVTNINLGKKYKQSKNIANLSKNDFKAITKNHLKKANYLVNDEYELPNEIIDSIDIFTAQLTKHINLNQEVATLSALPLFVLDYKGASYTKEL